MVYPIAFFDGATQNQICGCAIWLVMSLDLHYRAYWKAGSGTNNKVNAMALRGII